jgi:iron complex outermembrane receptor protein
MMVQPYWSMYAQYGKGQNIPPSSVFDVKNAQVGQPPEPVRSDTYQAGTVWKSNRATLDFDAYYISFQNDYSSSLDPITGDTLYFQNGSATTKGAEVESTILISRGFSAYLNATVARAKYKDTKLWVPNCPQDMETIGFSYNQRSWNVGLLSKRVGPMWNDNGAIHQAVKIDSFYLTNFFVNYNLGGSTRFGQTRIRLAVNNVGDSHPITAVTPASTKTNLPADGDVVTLMSGRSVSLSVTVGLGPKP